MENFINFDKAQTINVYKDGAKTEYPVGGKEYNKILTDWNSMIEGAHDMPAFGVSLNANTVEEIKKGLWVEFDFKKTLEHNEMPYEKLLICIAKGSYGFNLIRYNSPKGYDGRCFYFDLVGKNTDAFYELLKNL